MDDVRDDFDRDVSTKARWEIEALFKSIFIDEMSKEEMLDLLTEISHILKKAHSDFDKEVERWIKK